MKIKVIATGEIKEVMKHKSYPLQYIDKDGSIYTTEEAERIEDGSIDWERRRYEIAKDIQKLLAVDRVFYSAEDSARVALRYADELIKKLKG